MVDVNNSSLSLADFIARNYYVDSFIDVDDSDADYIPLLRNFFFTENYRSTNIVYSAVIDDNSTVMDTLKYGHNFKVVIKDKDDKVILDKSLYLVRIKRDASNYLSQNRRNLYLEFVDETYYKYLENPNLAIKFTKAKFSEIIENSFSSKGFSSVSVSSKLKEYVFDSLFVTTELLEFFQKFFIRFPLYFYYDRESKYWIRTNDDLKKLKENKLNLVFIPQEINVTMFEGQKITDNFFYSMKEINPFDFLDDVEDGRKFGTAIYGNGEKSIELPYSTSSDVLPESNKQNTSELKTLYKEGSFKSIQYQKLYPIMNENNPQIDYMKALIEKDADTLWDFEYQIQTSKPSLQIMDVVELNYLSPKYAERKIPDMKVEEMTETYQGFVIQITHGFTRYQGKNLSYSNSVNILSNSRPV